MYNKAPIKDVLYLYTEWYRFHCHGYAFLDRLPLEQRDQYPREQFDKKFCFSAAEPLSGIGALLRFLLDLCPNLTCLHVLQRVMSLSMYLTSLLQTPTTYATQPSTLQYLKYAEDQDIYELDLITARCHALRNLWIRSHPVDRIDGHSTYMSIFIEALLKACLYLAQLLLNRVNVP
ncbi:hypothetical protein BCR43DRAFT_559243 [Syncephalastrum racemosum]|uniref:Uncharacterized protein n=1 Tax=Syncephalastrum racemosum TaxID=13706 RepID=A0A1X2HRQ6_SYNRA|nr:hypothetical protein BCR43DRAFT_559243 [Syncephalastrum racemosum]